MRTDTMLMLGLCVAVIGGIIYFAVAKRSPMAVLGSIGGPATPRMAEKEPVTPAKPEEPKKAPAKMTAKIAARPAPAVVSAPESVPQAGPAEVAVAMAAPAPVRKGPQPNATDISIGMRRDELLRRFPDPAVQTSTIKNGDLIELLVYESSDNGVATFAQLLNGQVSRVYLGTPTRPGRRLTR